MSLFLHLVIYNLVISIILYASLAVNSRMWMHRMPPEVVQKVPPRTPAEKRLLYYFGIPFMLVLLIYPIAYVLPLDVSYWQRFLILAAFFAGFALWDTLVLDILIFCIITPRFIIMPGTTRQDYANKKYHLISGSKGVPMSLAFAALVALII